MKFRVQYVSGFKIVQGDWRLVLGGAVRFVIIPPKALQRPSGDELIRKLRLDQENS